MSGGLAWMIVAPSANSTIECTIDCGWTTTSIWSSPKPNSRCASITSRPLFTSVAELVVTSGPMRHVGCASACSGVTASSRSRGQPRNGPPLAVSTSRLTSEFAPARRHWAIVECSESTGTICPGLARLVTSGPPMISDSLLASASVRPASSAASVARRPGRAGHAVEHHVAGQARQVAHRLRAREDDDLARDEAVVVLAGPALVLADSSLIAAVTAAAAASSATATTGTPNSTACRASSAGLPPPAASAATRKRSGLRRAMSSAWVPIDPVEPRITTSRGASVSVTRSFLRQRATHCEPARRISPPVDFGESPTNRDCVFDIIPVPNESHVSVAGWSRSSQGSRSLPPCRRWPSAGGLLADPGAPVAEVSQQAVGAAAQAAAVRYWTTSRMTRDLVRQPPPGATQAWLSGDTNGAGLRWTHGGAVSAAVGRVFFTLGGTDYACSGALVAGDRTRTWCSPPRTASPARPGGAAPPSGRPTGCSCPASPNGRLPYGEYTARRFFVVARLDRARRRRAGRHRVRPGDRRGHAGRPGAGQAAPLPHGLPVAFASSQTAGAAATRSYVFGYPAEPPYSGLYPDYCAGPAIASAAAARGCRAA